LTCRASELLVNEALTAHLNSHPSRSVPFRRDASRCTPGMDTSSGVQVPRGSDDGNHKPMATASLRGGVGRKPEANPRPEEHEPRRRRGGPGESATRDEARVIKGPQRRRGGGAGKVGALIRGDLPGRRPRRKSPDTAAREGAGHPAEVSRGRSSGGIVRREGPNAKPRQRTIVLAEASAANPAQVGPSRNGCLG
jgi:hypothetical protein